MHLSSVVCTFNINSLYQITETALQYKEMTVVLSFIAISILSLLISMNSYIFLFTDGGNLSFGYCS